MVQYVRANLDDELTDVAHSLGCFIPRGTVAVIVLCIVCTPFHAHFLVRNSTPIPRSRLVTAKKGNEGAERHCTLLQKKYFAPTIILGAAVHMGWWNRRQKAVIKVTAVCKECCCDLCDSFLCFLP